MGSPKTGLATQMRDWMRAQRRAFSLAKVADGLGITDPTERDRVRSAGADFVRRGEIVRIGPKQYRYDQKWQAKSKGSIKPKVFKACYVKRSDFTAGDIQLLSGAPTLNFVHKLLRKLVESGFLTITTIKPGQGNGTFYYKVVDKIRFKMELL